MTNEKKNATLEDLIMEMLKEGKAVRVPMKDVVDKLQENAKASEDVQPEVAQPETEQPEKVLQDEQVKTVPINIRIDSLHIHMDERHRSNGWRCFERQRSYQGGSLRSIHGTKDCQGHRAGRLR